MKSGVIATSRAAMPDGIRDSATPTSEFASISSEPTIAAVRNCGAVGFGALRTFAMTRRIAPASVKRTHDSRNGGIVSIAKRIPT